MNISLTLGTQSILVLIESTMLKIYPEKRLYWFGVYLINEDELDSKFKRSDLLFPFIFKYKFQYLEF
jgi:hypothetical protein